MKTLTKIRLINWHLFENTTINCEGSTYFIGINGAGKSTILDAVQFALVGGQRDVRFNQAALAGGKRTLSSYVRGELGTEGQKFLRKDTTGVIALEFRNPDGSFFTHGAVIDAFADGRSPNLVYFIVNNADLDDQWFFQADGASGALYDVRGFKRHLDHFAFSAGVRAQTFSRLEDYRVHLLNRLGQLKESFPAKIVKGLAFSPLTNIRSFVHNYLLDENLLDVKTLQAQLDTLRHFEELASNVRGRISNLDKIESLDKERLANSRRRTTNGYIARRSQGEIHSKDLKKARVELDEIRLNLSRAEIQREELDDAQKFALTALLDAKGALEKDEAVRREKELKEKLITLLAELNILRQRQENATAALKKERADAKKLEKHLITDGQNIPTELDRFVTQSFDQAQDRHAARNTIINYQSIIADFSQDYTRQHAILNEEASNLRAEAKSLEDEIRKLKTGDREVSFESMAPQASKLRQLLRAELGLSSEEVVFLCTQLEIPNEEWQNAVEGILGKSRFTLLVPPVHYDSAMQLYRDHRKKSGLHGVALLDTERILKKHATRNTQQESLANEVKTSHPAARAFVDLLLQHYKKCDSLKELREHRTAITKECFVRRNYTDSHLNPRFYRRWFIGERATMSQIKNSQERLDELANEMVSYNERDGALKDRLALTSEKMRPLIQLENMLESISSLSEREIEEKSLKSELAKLDLGNAKTLKARAENAQGEYDRLLGQASQMDGRIGGMKVGAENLSEERIPRLEREIDESIQKADDFLATENVDEEARADVEKEYARRLERQPVAVIHENASRYEGDYQTAETRNRDRLRDAKQAYSMRYDFGYDDEDHAEKYMAERVKLVDSELPQFETQIAKQRALAEEELVENFIHRLREQIEEAKQQLAYLNKTLSNLRFGGERYEFITQPASNLRGMYAMVMDSQSVLGSSLFDSDFRQKHQQAWDLLLERLTHNNQSDASLSKELREIQDYRSYLQYDIRIHYPNNDRALLSKINAKKSGGETTTPFYVAMAASFAQAYRINQPRPSDTIRLALFDEAFGKMDTARTASALQFMRDAGLQVLLATPPDKSGALLPYVDTVCTVVRKNSHAFVIGVDKSEMMAELA